VRATRPNLLVQLTTSTPPLPPPTPLPHLMLQLLLLQLRRTAVMPYTNQRI